MHQPPPGQPLTAFLDGLDPDRRLALVNRLGAGLFNARHAAQCVSEAGTRHHATTLQLLTYLAGAIRSSCPTTINWAACSSRIASDDS